jgi:hypothetical protein
MRDEKPIPHLVHLTFFTDLHFVAKSGPSKHTFPLIFCGNIRPDLVSAGHFRADIKAGFMKFG